MPELGVCLPREPQRYDRRLLEALAGGPVEVFDTIGSTNDATRELFEQGAPHGAAALADQQTAGRGRMGRPFVSPSGTGIYVSVLLTAQAALENAHLVTPAAAVVTAGILERFTRAEIGIKWVNDLFCRGKKISGILTEAVRKRPYSVVLLDEVEKAHRDVMNLFYQVFDRGFMRDGEGREIDFRNTVILMTSNLGSDHLMQLLDEQPEATEGDLHELLRPILRDHFQPALLARFQTVIYRPLAEAAMRTIVEMKFAQVSKRLHRHYGLTTQIDESLYDALTSACLLPDTGARNVDSLLNQQILPVLSQQLLSHMAAKQKPTSLTLGWNEEEGIVLAFDEPATEPVRG